MAGVTFQIESNFNSNFSFMNFMSAIAVLQMGMSSPVFTFYRDRVAVSAGVLGSENTSIRTSSEQVTGPSLVQ